MFHVQELRSAKYEVKKSTFTSYLLPYSLFDSYHDRLKKENPKASHIIWAFRTLNAYGQIVEGSSDDGEPKGSAGTPTLNVLRGEELINSVLLTVRYFGGTKLGTGGMVRAYTQSAKAVLEASMIIPYEPKKSITFDTSYTITKRYEHYFDKHTIPYPNRLFHTDMVTWNVELTEDEIKDFDIFIKSL